MPVGRRNAVTERTPLDGRRDVLICGASFAGLAVARELAGSGADVLVLDRYEIGERQTSACGIPTDWLRATGLMDAELQRFGELVIHTPHGTARYELPWTFSTFDYRRICELLWRDCDARFETAKVNGRAHRPGRRAARSPSRPIAARSPRRWSSTRSAGAACSPAATATSRPTRRSRAASRSIPSGSGGDLEIWIDRRYVPAGYAWSFPAEDELRIGIGSFDPRFHVKDTTVLLDRGPRQGSRTSTRGTGSPTSCAGPPRAASSSPATRPATACR